MNKKYSVLIRIDSFEKMKKFATQVMKFESDINIYYGHQYCDAKSILAIINLDMNKSRYVEIIPKSESEEIMFFEYMKEFEVNE